MATDKGQRCLTIILAILVVTVASLIIYHLFLFPISIGPDKSAAPGAIDQFH